MNTKTKLPIVLRTQKKLRSARHIPGVYFRCSRCSAVLPVCPGGGLPTCGTQYGYDRRNRPTCYACCGEIDRQDMRATGRATLYLVQDTVHHELDRLDWMRAPRIERGRVANWPGSLSLPCGVKRGRHNIAGVRYDLWFTFEGFVWHGVQLGDNTQICRCMRTKEKTT